MLEFRQRNFFRLANDKFEEVVYEFETRLMDVEEDNVELLV
jgi:hypothetical protein